MFGMISPEIFGPWNCLLFRPLPGHLSRRRGLLVEFDSRARSGVCCGCTRTRCSGLCRRDERRREAGFCAEPSDRGPSGSMAARVRPTRQAGSLPILWWIARGERLTTPVVNHVTLLSGSRGNERMRIIGRRLRRWVLVANRGRRGWICHRFSILWFVQSCGCCEHVLVPQRQQRTGAQG
jgi:hypothetical protein